MRKTKIIKTKIASKEYGVTSIETTGAARHVTRHEPCAQCPWREDVPTGVFPAEAFRLSAPTAYDAAMSTFACHMSGSDKPATCAGFLLRHGENNLGVRISHATERLSSALVSDGGHPVYPSYREMAIANGVSPDDTSLSGVRGQNDEWDRTTGQWSPRKSKG